jgi:Brp/Blh family beta-carotene 15,15'-monooxygenase
MSAPQSTRATLILSAITLGVLALSRIPADLPPAVEWSVFIGLMLLSGLPHGATDHYLARIDRRRRGQPFNEWRFVGRYLLAVAAMGLLWWAVPKISLCGFLLYSAVHFGQAQLAPHVEKAPTWVRSALFTVWGLTVLGAILLAHHGVALEILAPIIGPGLRSSIIGWVSIAGLEAVLALGGLTAIGLVAAAMAGFGSWREIAAEILGILILLGLAFGTSLLISFAVFFGLWHSGKSILSLRRYFQSHLKPSFSLADFYTAAARYSIISVLGIGALIVLAVATGDAFPLLLVFFIFISAVTVPHMWLIDQVYTPEDDSGDANPQASKKPLA